MNLKNVPDLNIDDKDEYIKSLESAVEKLRQENKLLESSVKSDDENKYNYKNCSFYDYNDIKSIMDAVHKEINNVFAIIESTLLFYESNKLIKIKDIIISDKMNSNINYLEEEGIFDWINSLKTSRIIPNLNLDGTETGRFFLLVPVSLHNNVFGIFIASTDLSQSELKDDIATVIRRLCTAASLSIDYLKQKNQNEILTNKLENLEKAVIANAGLISIAEITSAVSLEMEEPIKVISGHLDMLENGIGNVEVRLKTIKKQFGKIKEVVSKITHIDDGQKEQTNVHNIAEVINDAMNLISSQMQKEGIDFKLNNELDKPNIKCKINLLTQLFLDIFLFQRSRMPDGGQISITAFNQGNKINISIIDNGIGLENDELNNIFEPFKSEKSVNLFFVKQIILSHKGKINLISDNNSGNSIKIQFPVFDL
jgi:signal transduction histidine kinase